MSKWWINARIVKDGYTRQMMLKMECDHPHGPTIPEVHAWLALQYMKVDGMITAITPVDDSPDLSRVEHKVGPAPEENNR